MIFFDISEKNSVSQKKTEFTDYFCVYMLHITKALLNKCGIDSFRALVGFWPKALKIVMLWAWVMDHGNHNWILSFMEP